MDNVATEAQWRYGKVQKGTPKTEVEWTEPKVKADQNYLKIKNPCKPFIYLFLPISIGSEEANQLQN